jgi:hypothetical protein
VLQRIISLPPETQQLQFLAAADPAGDVTMPRNAADELGIAADAIIPAESAGLVELGVRVRFRHPLLRWATYGAACLAERRRAHASLADATDPQAEPDRRAWHHAHATAAQGKFDAGALEVPRICSRRWRCSRLAVARRLEPLDPQLAREVHLEALWAAVRGGRLANTDGVLEAAQAAMASAPDRLTRGIDLLLDGLITRLGQGYAAALPTLARALEAFVDECVSHENIAWCCLACELAMDLWNHEASAQIAGEVATRARARGALGLLPGSACGYCPS